MATTSAAGAPPGGFGVTEEVPVVEGEVEAARPPWYRRKPTLVAAAAVVVVVGAGLGIWLGTSGGSSTPTLQVSDQVVSVTTGTMKQTVSTSGTIEPASTASLDFAVSGQVTAVDVTTGQTVSVGQVLATVDPTALQAELAVAQATLTSAEAALASDQADSAAATQIDSDTAAVTTAQTNVATAQANLTDASLTSTIAGTVASVDLTVGQQVTGSSGSASSSASGSDSSSDAGSSGTSTGTSSTSSDSDSSSSSSAQVTVISTGSYLVSGTVDDTEVGEVKAGDQAVITPSSSTTAVYGTVSSVGLIASSSSDVATFPVTIAVTGSPTGLYAGATASVSIVVKELSDVVEVPTAAISYSGASSTVTVVEDGKHVTRSVTVGEALDGETQITSGLTAGDKVLEKVVTFKSGTAGGSRSLFGGTTSGGGSAGFSGTRTGGAPGAGASVVDPTGPSPVIELDAVTKVYRTGAFTVAALRGVTMTITEGEYVAIMGPSGSGKSTLMHILGCLDAPSSGTYRLAGEHVSGMSEAALASVRNRRIGFVFQQFNLLASLSAWRNVELPLVYAGVDRVERRERAMAALERVGLGSRVQHRPGELSGGQQQRVAIARALVSEPALILADEPTGALDSTSAGDVMALLDELHAAGRTLVLITHDADVASVTERTIGIRDGLVTERELVR